MAVTSYGVNDALSNKLWAKKLTVEALKPTYFGRFMGTGSSAMIHVKTETSKAAGDKVTFGLRTQLQGAGTTEGQTLEGNEESLTTYSDSIFINELMHAVRVRSENSIDAQRVPFNLRDEGKDGMVDWFSDRFDQCMFNHLGGVTGLMANGASASDPRYNGNNTPTAPSANRKVFAGAAGNLTDEVLDDAASESFNLNLIDKCVERAKTATPLIRPIKVNGGDMFVMFIHPYQTFDLRTSTTVGQWLDIQKAALAGGDGDSSPIFTGALGVYNNVVLHESVRVPNGYNSTTNALLPNVRRAIFCGAQAGALAWSQKFGGGDANYKWVEHLFDYERELGISAQTIWGIKKTVFNSLDFGTIVASTYAAAH